MRLALALTVSLAIAGSAGAQQRSPAPATSHAGTLTCTMTATPSQAATEAEVSCNFHALVGAGGTFEGVIARDSQSDLPAGKRVLVWSVLAPGMEIDLKSLAGKYVGRTGAGSVAQLFNQSSGIVLEPVTPTSQLGSEPAITVLSLRLDPIRA